MDWLVLTSAAAEAVSQVLVVVACGVILSRTGYLSQSAQKSISKVNLYFMTPCLLFTKIVSTINWNQFKAFWPIPVFYALFSAISWLVSKVGSRLLRFSEDEEKFVIASVLFSNTNTLPIALVQSLAFSAAGEHLLRDKNDTREDVAARGISYILFYAIFGNLVRWSYGFTLLVPKKQEDSKDSIPAPSVLINVDVPVSRDGDAAFAPTKSPTPAPNTTDYLQPYSAAQSHSPSVSFKSPTESDGMRIALTAYEGLRQVLTPPLITALMSLVIGLVPVLHHLFMSPDSIVYRFLVRPIESCGASAIPMILLCLGAQVVHFATTSTEPSATTLIKDGKQRLKNAKPPPVLSSLEQTGLGIYNPSPDEFSSGEGRNGHESSAHSPYNTCNSDEVETYGGGIAAARSHASSSATLLQYNQPIYMTSNGRQGSSSTASEESEEDNDDPNETSPLLNLSKSAKEPHRLMRWVSPVSFILFARMVLVPLVCLPAIIFHPDSLSPVLTMDPTFSLTLVLIVAAPTAINLIQMCQIDGFFENEMASVLFWSYCVFGIPCVLGWSMVGLWAAARE
ncbi:hypothetical protein BGZ58_006412 [Dissophora ornata]|nr:hypothetical protein BGZ58_006412 [Dissophora ornata]